MSIRTKLVLFLVIICITVTFVSILTAVTVASDFAKNSTKQNKQQVLTTLRKDVEIQIKETIEPLLNYANITQYLLSATNEEGIEDLSWGISSAFRSFSTLGFIDIFVILKDGKTVGKDGLIDLEFPKEQVENILRNEAEIDFYLPFQFQDRNTIAFFSPVKDSDGQTLGVLVALKDMNFFQKLIKERQLGNTGYLAISYKSIIIAHPNQQYVGTLDLAKEKGTEPLGKAILEKEKGEVTYNFNGKKVAFFEKVGKYPITVIGILPLSEVTQAANRIITSGIFAGIIIALASALVALFLSDSIVKRINFAVEIAKKVAENDLTVTVDMEKMGKDEIAKLSEAFKTLIDSFRQTVAEVMKLGAQVTSVSFMMDELSQTSSQAAQGSKETVQKTALEVQDIAAATEERLHINFVSNHLHHNILVETSD